MSPFSRFVKSARRRQGLVVQPRMGFSDPGRMRQGLIATRSSRAPTVGTITLDSYTRVGDHEAVRDALAKGHDLNGYPLVDLGPDTTRQVLSGVASPDFPVQVRHGSAQPQEIFRSLVQAGLSATEGGPVSYCLPYGRIPLRDSVAAWNDSCRMLVESARTVPHLETFGGCMLGQLCPPSLLIAISILEARFFANLGILSVSLSYAQQTNKSQDEEALMALRQLAAEFLPNLDVHIVLYAYMGVYPRTRRGALGLLSQAASLAERAGAERLIVKTVAEAHRIPDITENVEALEAAATTARDAAGHSTLIGADTGILAEARALVEAVLCLSEDPGIALLNAFHQGWLDVPYCLHPDNASRSRSYLDSAGALRWADVGRMPIPAETVAGTHNRDGLSSADLARDLTYVQRSYDKMLPPADTQIWSVPGHAKGKMQ